MDQQTDVSTSEGRIRALYRSPADGSPPLVPHGMLPKLSRKAEGWESTARQRMHALLQPATRATDAEVQALEEAGIPLVPRPKGGFNIDPAVPRQSDESAAAAGDASATRIAMLYGLAPGSSALVPLGVLPARTRDAKGWKKTARERMHSLLQPATRASAAEVKVLTDARIPLVPRKEGGFNIDPAVPRQSGRKKEGGTVVVLQSGQPAAADALAPAPSATTADASAPPPAIRTGADVPAGTNTLSGWGPTGTCRRRRSRTAPRSTRCMREPTGKSLNQPSLTAA